MLNLWKNGWDCLYGCRYKVTGRMGLLSGEVTVKLLCLSLEKRSTLKGKKISLELTPLQKRLYVQEYKQKVTKVVSLAEMVENQPRVYSLVKLKTKIPNIRQCMIKSKCSAQPWTETQACLGLCCYNFSRILYALALCVIYFRLKTQRRKENSSLTWQVL